MRGLIVLAMFAVSFVYTQDSSDSVDIRDTGESATVDDDSGSVHVQDVDSDLIVESDGSIRLSFNDIHGNVDSGT
jgi:hypothetical protein